MFLKQHVGFLHLHQASYMQSAGTTHCSLSGIALLFIEVTNFILLECVNKVVGNQCILGEFSRGSDLASILRIYRDRKACFLQSLAITPQQA